MAYNRGFLIEHALAQVLTIEVKIEFLRQLQMLSKQIKSFHSAIAIVMIYHFQPEYEIIGYTKILLRMYNHIISKFV